jgi:hypothetical protein
MMNLKEKSNIEQHERKKKNEERKNPSLIYDRKGKRRT